MLLTSPISSFEGSPENHRGKKTATSFEGGLWGITPVLLALTLSLMLFTACSSQEKSTATEIIAGTSLIADIIADLTDASVGTYTMLPSASCPSQFDLKSGDIVRLQQAKLLFLHPWQLQLDNIRRVLEAAKVPEDHICIVKVPGNWMIPEVQVQAVTTLAALLTALYPDQKEMIQTRSDARIEDIRKTAAQSKEILDAAGSSKVTVLCNKMQAPFVQWAGFDLVDTYDRPEDWSVAETERLVKLGQEHKVALVIDNLQSGGLRMSETLARDIGAANVVLSNFPNGLPKTPTWKATFMENINQLHKALKNTP